MRYSPIPFDTLVGKTIVGIEGEVGDEELILACSDGTTYRMCHYQDCCERVQVEDICGDLLDLIGSPILRAEESTSKDIDPPDYQPNDEGYNYRESFRWTFYKIDTVRGGITIRWLGTSNGYYSERVNFEEVEPGER